MKKLISLFLAFVLIIGCTNIVFAESDNSAPDDNSINSSVTSDDSALDNDAMESKALEQEEALREANENDANETNDAVEESFIDIPDTFVIDTSDIFHIPITMSSDIKEGDVVWTSSNTSFHASSFGIIWSLDSGYSIVTASVPELGLSDTCTVILYPNYITPANMTIGVGDWYSVSLGLRSNDKVAFTSSNNRVATVTSTGSVKGVSSGTCTITATFFEKSYTCRVTVKAGLNYTYLELYKGEKARLKVYGYGSKKTKWKSSKKSVASVSSSGTVKGKKIGKTTITAKKGGKKFKCKVKVVRMEPDFGAVLYDYNTRSNYFVVKFRNNGPKTLTVTSGIKVEDVDYKSFDRKIKLKKKVKIKRGKTKYVKFYVKGRVTWYDYQDFTLGYKFKYDGKQYTGHVWDEDSVYKHGKYWYGTYWDEDWYYRWY